MIINKIANSPTMMTWINLASKTIGLIILLPLILNRFSDEDVVLWYSFSSMLGIGLLFDLGLTSNFTRVIAYTRGSENSEAFSNSKIKVSFNKIPTKQILKIISDCYKYILFIATILLLTIGSWAMRSPISESSNSFYGWITWFLFIISVIANLYANKYNAILHGFENIALSQRVLAVFSMLSLLLSIFSIIIMKNIYITVLLYSFINASSIFYLRGYAKLIEANLDKNFSSPYADKTVLLSIISMAWKASLGMIFSIGIVNASSIFIANVLDAKDAAEYMLAMQLIRVVSTYSQTPFYTKLPLMAKYYASGNRKLIPLALKNQIISIALYVLGVQALVVGPEILKVDIAFLEHMPDKSLWYLFSLAILTERFGAMHIQIYTLTSDIIWHWANGLTGLAIFVCVFFLRYIGFEMVLIFPFSFFVSYALIYFPICTYYANKVVGIRFVSFQVALYISIALMFIVQGKLYNVILLI